MKMAYVVNLNTFKVVLFLQIVLLHHPVHSTPEGCYRSGELLSCQGLKSFPRPFASDASSVLIYNSNLEEIPPKAFKDVPKMKNLDIYQSDIGTIKPCAFRTKQTIKRLTIYSSKINTVDSYAFSNIVGATSSTMSLYMLLIKNIRSYAFDNIKGFDSFSMYKINVTDIQSYAFNQLNTSFSMYQSHLNTVGPGAFQNFHSGVTIYSSFVHNLGCNTFDTLHKELGKKFSLYLMKFNCDCDLLWFVKALNSTPDISWYSLSCYQPEALNNTALKKVTEEQLCAGNTPKTCDGSSVKPPKVSVDCESVASKLGTLYVNVLVFVLIIELFL